MPLLLELNFIDATYNEGAGAMTLPNAPYIADAYGLLHDAASAARYMAASNPDNAYAKTEALLLHVYPALDRDDVAAALPPMEVFWKTWQGSAMLASQRRGPSVLARAHPWFCKPTR